jgi:hypothetical protein
MKTKNYVRLVKIRNLIISKCMRKIVILDEDNNIVDNKCIIFLVNMLYYINLKHLLKLFNINTVYKLDNLHYYDQNKSEKIKINSVIISIKIDDHDISDIIKKYSLDVPIKHMLHIENIKSGNKICINMLKLFNLQYIEYDINSVLEKKIYEIL